MTALDVLALVLVRAQEAWEPVLLGGLIPFLGLVAVGYIVYRAVRDTDEGSDERIPDPPVSGPKQGAGGDSGPQASAGPGAGERGGGA